MPICMRISVRTGTRREEEAELDQLRVQAHKLARSMEIKIRKAEIAFLNLFLFRKTSTTIND